MSMEIEPKQFESKTFEQMKSISTKYNNEINKEFMSIESSQNDILDARE